MATIKGTALKWGVGTAATSGITTMHSVQSTDFTQNCDLAEARAEDGDVEGIALYNNKKSITLTAFTTEATIPTMGTKVTLTNTDSAALDGDYHCIGCRIRESNTDFVTFEADLVKYEDIAPV